MSDDDRPIRRLPNGRFRLDLTPHERSLLRGLPGELIKQIESGDDYGSLFRLFPPGYSDDLGKQFEYDRLLRDDLQDRHIATLRTVADTADAAELSEDEVQVWMRALNQLRLVLGSRLAIDDDTSEESFAATDPRSGAYALYLYLGALQHCAVDALTSLLPEGDSDWDDLVSGLEGWGELDLEHPPEDQN